MKPRSILISIVTLSAALVFIAFSASFFEAMNGDTEISSNLMGDYVTCVILTFAIFLPIPLAVLTYIFGEKRHKLAIVLNAAIIFIAAIIGTMLLIQSIAIPIKSLMPVEQGGTNYASWIPTVVFIFVPGVIFEAITVITAILSIKEAKTELGL